MGKTKKLGLLGLLAAMIVTGIWIWQTRFVNTQPFADLKPEDIRQAAVEMYPPGKSFNLSQEDTEQLVSLLNRITTGPKDHSYRNYNGQVIVFTLVRLDATQFTVQPYGSCLIIDGVGYQAEEDDCAALNRLASWHPEALAR